jgi:hypothetical protein
VDEQHRLAGAPLDDVELDPRTFHLHRHG